MQIRQSTYPIEINFFDDKHRFTHNTSIRDTKESEISRYLEIYQACKTVDDAYYFGIAIEKMGGTVPPHKMFGVIKRLSNKQTFPIKQERKLVTLSQKDKNLLPQLSSKNEEIIQVFRLYVEKYEGSKEGLISFLYQKSIEKFDDPHYSWFFINQIQKMHISRLTLNVEYCDRIATKQGFEPNEKLIFDLDLFFESFNIKPN